MTGWQLAAALMDSAKPPVLIAVSGACGASADERSARAGINLHLHKPVDPAKLVGVLRRVDDILKASGRSRRRCAVLERGGGP